MTHEPETHDGPGLRRHLLIWAASALVGAALGAGLALAFPLGPRVSILLCLPFVLLLSSIAVMPFISGRFWHRHYPGVALGLGSLVLAFALTGLGPHGRHMMAHAGLEYYSFIALVGGLYVASGGILIDVRDRGRPVSNAILLAFGAVLANLVGTTGASVLLIRPFMRMNQGRLRTLHIVFFIFIVSNCGGCLTPIGDPPLYLGYLKGVPFFWTLSHLWPMWLLTNGVLIAAFVLFDRRVPVAPPAPGGRYRVFDPQHRTPLVSGWPAVGFLVLLVAGVFIDPMLARHAGVTGLPIGATFQITIAAVAFLTARPSIHHANRFTFAPVKEVGFLFAGIFLTMAPALEYLSANAGALGIGSPTRFYFGTGMLSAFLDNAPTYICFLQLALAGLAPPLALDPAGVAAFIATASGRSTLEAISLGAVFFGAMTYIGNGPNFMVKSIVDSAHASGQGGVRMPSFFGYFGLAALILLPVLALNWLLFIR